MTTIVVTPAVTQINLGGFGIAASGTFSTANRVVTVKDTNRVQESTLDNAVTGAQLVLTATLTADRAFTLPDQDVTISAFGASLVDDANAAAGRTTLGVVIGTDVQAYDAGLQSISGLTTAADTMIYTTALDVYATTSLTSYARTLLDDADAGTARTTLGLGTIATQAANSVDIDGGAIDGTAIGATTASTGRFSTLSTTGNVGFGIAANTYALDILTSGNNGIRLDNGTNQIYLGNTGGAAVIGTLTNHDYAFVRSGATRLTMQSGAVVAAVPLQNASYTVATVPTATAARQIYVSDETGGATLAFADGTNWRRVQDRAVVA